MKTCHVPRHPYFHGSGHTFYDVAPQTTLGRAWRPTAHRPDGRCNQARLGSKQKRLNENLIKARQAASLTVHVPNSKRTRVFSKGRFSSMPGLWHVLLQDPPQMGQEVRHTLRSFTKCTPSAVSRARENCRWGWYHPRLRAHRLGADAEGQSPASAPHGPLEAQLTGQPSSPDCQGAPAGPRSPS